MKHIDIHGDEGWFSFQKLYSDWAKNVQNNGKIVEVGVWRGRSISYLAVEIINTGKNIDLYAVDTWLGSEEHKNIEVIKEGKLYEEFMNNIFLLKDYIKPIRIPSIEAAKTFEDDSIDAVFIDACHSVECVKEDLDAWYPKIKKNGGIIAGHDWHSGDIQEGFRRSVVGKLAATKYKNFHVDSSEDVFVYTNR